MNYPTGTMGIESPNLNSSEDPLSMFFDFGIGSPPQQDVEAVQISSTRKSQEPPPRGGIRVSLACVPVCSNITPFFKSPADTSKCRSRHVKCGAEMPNCSRCLQDDKPCFYAKSRRGMRDRNAPKKRASMREAGRGSPVQASSSGPSINSLSYLRANSSNDSYTGPSSDGSASPESLSSKLSGKVATPKRLLDLYYRYDHSNSESDGRMLTLYSSFHKAHPFLLPRYYFHNRLQSDPESLKFLSPVMKWIGSMYSSDMISAELRDIAMSQIEMENLPPNGFTVQALLLAAIALHSQDDMVRSRAILDRTIYLALKIRMNSRTFANMERDPVLAESWRRTYWFMYVTDAKFAAFRNATHFMYAGSRLLTWWLR